MTKTNKRNYDISPAVDSDAVEWFCWNQPVVNLNIVFQLSSFTPPTKSPLSSLSFSLTSTRLLLPLYLRLYLRCFPPVTRNPCLSLTGAQPALDPDHGERGAVGQGKLHLSGGEWVRSHQPHLHPGCSRSVPMYKKHTLRVHLWGWQRWEEEGGRQAERVLTVRMLCVCVFDCPGALWMQVQVKERCQKCTSTVLMSSAFT